MTPWRVRVWDWNANQALRFIRPDEVTITQTLGQPDTIAVTAPSLGARSSSGLLTVGRRFIIVERGSVILSAGLLWSANDDGSTLRLEARGLTAVLGRRLLRSSAAMTHDENKMRPKWIGVDQFHIVGDVLANAQFAAGADLGLTLTFGALSGVTRNADVDRNAGTMALDFINDLAQRNNGFDWREDWHWSAGQPERVIKLAPRLGQRLTSIRLEHGRNVHGYDLGDTIDGMVTGALGVGDRRRVYVAGLNGWPLFESLVSRPKLRNLAMLTTRAQAEVNRNNQPFRSLGLDIGDRPTPGTYSLGDEVFAIVKAAKTNPGTGPDDPDAGGYADVAEWRRITGITLNYKDSIESGKLTTEVSEL